GAATHGCVVHSRAGKRATMPRPGTASVVVADLPHHPRDGVRVGQAEDEDLPASIDDYAAAKRSFIVRGVRELERRANDPYPRPLAIDVAADYAMLGDNDKAFAWLAKALREHDGPLMYVKVDDRLDGLRSDTRLGDIIRAVGLVP